MDEDSRAVSDRLRDETIADALANAKPWLAMSGMRRLRRLGALQLAIGGLFVGCWFVLATSDWGATLFAIIVAETIFLSMAAAMLLRPERTIRLNARMSAPGDGSKNPFVGMP